MGNGVVAQLQHLDVPNSLGAKVVGRKKTRGGRAAGAEKGGISLRHFSMKGDGLYLLFMLSKRLISFVHLEPLKIFRN